MDGRSREYNEARVLKRIREYGGASIFWITEHPRLASATQRLQDSGVIIRHRENKHDRYPWCVFFNQGLKWRY